MLIATESPPILWFPRRGGMFIAFYFTFRSYGTKEMDYLVFYKHIVPTMINIRHSSPHVIEMSYRTQT